MIFFADIVLKKKNVSSKFYWESGMGDAEHAQRDVWRNVDAELRNREK